MQRYALAQSGRIRQQVLVAVPRRAWDRTIATRNPDVHRLLVPVDASLQAIDALRYIAERLIGYVAGVHLVNVQRPLMSGDIGSAVSANMVWELRQAAGERVLGLVREALGGSVIPITSQVAFGDPAERICRIAKERGCSGIVLGKDGFELHELIRGTVTSRILRRAGVPVTIVNSRTSAAVASERMRSRSMEVMPTMAAPRIDQARRAGWGSNKPLVSSDNCSCQETLAS